MDVNNLPEIYDLIEWCGFKYNPDVCTRDEIDSYYKLLTTYNEVERFNFSSDYWGDADEYQEDNLQLFEMLEDIGVGNLCKGTYYEDGEIVVYKYLGIAIDRQYNSISHTKVIVEEVEVISTEEVE